MLFEFCEGYIIAAPNHCLRIHMRPVGGRCQTFSFEVRVGHHAFSTLGTNRVRLPILFSLPDIFLFSFFLCLADYERDSPPCRVVFFGLATNALNVINNQKV